MQQIRLDEDIRPLSEFRSGVASFIKNVSDTRRTLVLTQHGRGVAVVVDIREFESMRERLAILDDIQAARTEIAAGEGMASSEAREAVLKAIGA